MALPPVPFSRADKLRFGDQAELRRWRQRTATAFDENHLATEFSHRLEPVRRFTPIENVADPGLKREQNLALFGYM